jgi:hypothetical protein
MKVEHLGAHRLRLTFSDGLVREVDLDPILHGGVFEALREEGTFAQVAVDPVAGTIYWPNGVDLDPDVLHGDLPTATGSSPTVIDEHQLRSTG